MKANAPEKIYLEAIYSDNGVLLNGLNYTPSPTDIEYTRTDAFIEKASDFISSLRRLDDDVIDEFRKYMERE